MMKGGVPIRRLERPQEDRPYLTPALIDVTNAKDRPTPNCSARCSS
jgi:succinylglutamic semialdehyde dehydrogenase